MTNTAQQEARDEQEAKREEVLAKLCPVAELLAQELGKLGYNAFFNPLGDIIRVSAEDIDNVHLDVSIHLAKSSFAWHNGSPTGKIAVELWSYNSHNSGERRRYAPKNWTAQHKAPSAFDELVKLEAARAETLSKKRERTEIAKETLISLADRAGIEMTEWGRHNGNEVSVKRDDVSITLKRDKYDVIRVSIEMAIVPENPEQLAKMEKFLANAMKQF